MLTSTLRRIPALSMTIPALLACALACGGGDEPKKPLAKKAEKLEIEKPKAAGVMKFTVDSASSKLGFTMDAPFEKIRGKVPATALTGTVYADLTDITKSKALVHVNIKDIELFQRKKAEGDAEFGEEVKEPTQNEHARQWLEIGEDAPEDIRAKNQLIEFSVTGIKNASEKNVDGMKGDTRTVTFAATGEFLLHQRKASKDSEIEATFTYKDGKPVSVAVKTTKPLLIGLDEYDVRPRKGFGVLAAKTLEALSPKVAKEASVTVEFTATLDPDAKMPDSKATAEDVKPAGPGAGLEETKAAGDGKPADGKAAKGGKKPAEKAKAGGW